MAGRGSYVPGQRGYSKQNPKPVQPKRQWYEYLPLVSKGFDDKLTQYQNEYNEWMWKRDTEYDSLEQQRKRMEEAGFNPALMYDNAGGNLAANQTEAQVATGAPDNVGTVLSTLMDGRMKVAQIKDVEAAAGLKTAQAQDLLKDMKSKDTVWYRRDGKPIDWKSMTSRDRKAWFESIEKIDKATQEYHRAGSEKEKKEILQKINNLQNIMMIMNMVTGTGRMLGSFF